MAAVKAHKVVAALPGTLEADSIYFVRTGVGFDIYVTNSSGLVVAYPLNGGAGSGGISSTATLTFTGQRSLKATTTVAGATVGTPVVASASLDMPPGVPADELEMDPITVAARVSSTDTVEIMATASSPLRGARTISLRIG